MHETGKSDNVSCPRATTALLFTAEQVVDAGGLGIDQKLIPELTRELMAIYVTLSWMDGCYRRVAADAVAILADRSPAALDIVIADAKRCADQAEMNGASPCSPNSFEVLAKTRSSAKSISFLRETIKNRRGIPRWQAIEALSRIDPLAAAQSLHEVNYILSDNARRGTAGAPRGAQAAARRSGSARYRTAAGRASPARARPRS